MTTQHTPGPWEVSDTDIHGRCIIARNRHGAAITVGHAVESTNLPTEANARRIVACVNACEGIPTEHLEQYQVGELLEVLEQREDTLSETVTGNGKLLQQRDELLAVLQAFESWYADHFDDFAPDINAQLLCLSNDASAAIAKAKG